MKRHRIQPTGIRRMLLGLVVGISAWGILRLIDYCSSVLVFSAYTVVFTSGMVAGYAGGRSGFILGGVIGLVDFALLLGWLHSISFLGECAASDPIFLFAVYGFGLSVIPGAVGGYLGERIVRFRRRRTSPADQ